jgi:D-3-phosphoglycerate dehydrogenase / 2-oxoglutarate reductase
MCSRLGLADVRVAVLDDYTDTVRSLPCATRLTDHEVSVYTDHTDDPDELAARLAGIEALCLFRERTAIRAELLERLDALRLVSLRSVYPHVDVDACTRLGVVVSSDLHPATPSVATAELTWALVLAGSRRLVEQATALAEGRWQTAVGRTLQGRTLGILGYGRIGQVVAGYGRAFGMGVLAFGGDASRARASQDGVELADSKRSLFERADVLSVHVRLVDATRGIVTRADLDAMAPDALFVNTSRAGLVEPGALASALRAGRPGGCAVDVFEHEPLFGSTDELVGLPGAVCTPHVGFVTAEELEVQFDEVFAQVQAFAAGTPTNVVNPEVLSSPSLRTAPGAAASR